MTYVCGQFTGSCSVLPCRGISSMWRLRRTVVRP